MRTSGLNHTQRSTFSLTEQKLDATLDWVPRIWCLSVKSTWTLADQDPGKRNPIVSHSSTGLQNPCNYHSSVVCSADDQFSVQKRALCTRHAARLRFVTLTHGSMSRITRRVRAISKKAILVRSLFPDGLPLGGLPFEELVPSLFVCDFEVGEVGRVFAPRSLQSWRKLQTSLLSHTFLLFSSGVNLLLSFQHSLTSYRFCFSPVFPSRCFRFWPQNSGLSFSDPRNPPRRPPTPDSLASHLPPPAPAQRPVRTMTNSFELIRLPHSHLV